MHRARKQVPSCVPLCALVLALVSARSALAAYSQPDLAGTWRSQTLASGPGAPWWERGLALITSGGALTSYAIDSFGDRDTTYGMLVLASDGVITLTAPTDFRGALDLGRTVMAGTDSWSNDGTSELRLALRIVGGTVTSDLAGPWEFNSIVSGPGAPWWIRGRQVIAIDGSFTGTFTESTGASEPVSGVMAVAPDGSLGISFAPAAMGWLDAGRSVLVMTNTWPDGSTELITGLRMASSYSQSDLAGTWQVRTLASGPGAPWWSRGVVSVATNGGFAGTMTDPTGDSWPVSGTFTLGSDGVVTRNGGGVARGVLDAGRTVMVWTDTWSGSGAGTAELMTFVRTDGSTADVPAPPAEAFALGRPSPNPARAGALTVRFALADASAARLELLDVAGRAIEVRDVGAMGAGAHTVVLAAARGLRAGLYFVRLRQGTHERVARWTVIE